MITSSSKFNFEVAEYRIFIYPEDTEEQERLDRRDANFIRLQFCVCELALMVCVWVYAHTCVYILNKKYI